MKIFSGRNVSIDAGRFICAFLVVALHTYFPIPALGPYVADVAKIAVPFFLLVSGYYLWSEDDDVVLTRVRHGIRKLLGMVFWAMVVYGVLRFVKSQYFHIDISNQSFQIIPFFIFNDANFTEHLWYLFACLYVLVVVILFAKFNQVNFLLYFIPIFFVISFAFIVWSRTLPISGKIAWYELNWFVSALPFVVLGMFLRKQVLMLRAMSVKLILATSLILLIFIFPEHYAFKQFLGRGPGVFSSTFLAVLLFVYCVSNGRLIASNIDEKIAAWGRNYAASIYVYHIFVRELLSLAGAGRWVNNTVGVFLLTFFISAIAIRFKNKLMRKINLGCIS